MRKFHRWLGLALFVFLVNAAATGALRANAKALYWKDHTKPPAAAALVEPAVGVGDAMRRFGERFEGVPVTRVELKNFRGGAVYRIEGSLGKKKTAAVLDAASGAWLSFDETAARDIAASSMEGKIAGVEKLSGYKARKMSEPRPAFKVVFADARKTEVFVDAETGETLNVLDDGKRFGLLVNRLHELDFRGLGAPALTALGLLVVVLSMTGLFLGWRTLTKPGRLR
jgi:uncharacterized membrane protein YkoI